MTKITLTGCSPDPLMSNLKALGIFRIIAEQADPCVTACWNNNRFIIYTKMTENDIITFFLEKYMPTPIVSPWNNGSGFYDKKQSSVDHIRNSENSRMKEYQNTIKKIDEIIAEIVPEYVEFRKMKIRGEDESKINDASKIIKKITDEKKGEILRQCRNKVRDDIIPWLDAAYAINSNKPSYGPMLGSGGNDGNFEISANFMEWTSKLIDGTDKDRSKKQSTYGRRESLLKNSLFQEYAYLEDSSFAYFYPGGYVGPAICGKNKKYSMLNPWDFILTIEGTMLFAGSISRRSNSRLAAFPFIASASTAGYDTACEEKNRGEIWIPLWRQPATYEEIKHVFNEGRVQIDAKNASSGVDFAKAIVTLGIESGLSAFYRFGIFERKGLAYFATCLGKIDTKINQKTHLLSDLDDWLNRIKQAQRRLKNPPKSMDSLLRNMDDAIIKFCTYETKKYLQQVLIVAGKIERLVSYSSNFNVKIDPMPELSYEWIDACYDNTPEYRLAVSLAAISSSEQPIRNNLEPITDDKYPKWKAKSPKMVWRNTDLIHNMIAILERRCIESQKSKSRIQLYSPMPAPLKDVMLFLNGNVDYNKISDMLLALSTIRYNNQDLPKYYNERAIWELPDYIPEPYIALKSNFPPMAYKNEGCRKNTV